MLRVVTVLILLLPALSSCGLAERFFTTDECEGDNCRAPVLLDNSNVEKKWFCYGSEQGEEWQCQNEMDPSKIRAVQPKTAPPRQIPAPVSIVEAAPELPVQRRPESDISDDILDLPRDHYAVQLIALRNIEGVREYASLNGIQEPQLVRIRNDESDWFVLLLGTYSQHSEAEAAREAWLTAKVLRVQPWIRQLGPLQDAIRAARG